MDIPSKCDQDIVFQTMGWDGRDFKFTNISLVGPCGHLCQILRYVITVVLAGQGAVHWLGRIKR